jgi:hypothetical protein
VRRQVDLVEKERRILLKAVPFFAKGNPLSLYRFIAVERVNPAVRALRLGHHVSRAGQY